MHITSSATWARWRAAALGVMALAGVLTLVLAVYLLRPISTAPFPGEPGAPAPNSIAVVERWPINGVEQSVIIRGRDLSNPVLIWVGDLWCETPLLRHFNADLENHFVVVYWCQRHSGQSLDPFIAPPTRLTIDQYVADLGALVEGVRAKLHKDKVVLVGHSSGTIFGLLYAQRHPEHVAAYVGVGQVVNQAKSLAQAYPFALAQARARANGQAIAELERIGPPPHTADQSAILRKWIIAFGGAFHGNLSYSRLALIGITSREANWRDLFAFVRGDQYTAAIVPEMSVVAFDDPDPKFSVPVFLLSGRYDHRTDGALAEAFLGRITAPKKDFAWFEQSAHSPNFEEPTAFNGWITAHIRPLAAAER